MRKIRESTPRLRAAAIVAAAAVATTVGAGVVATPAHASTPGCHLPGLSGTSHLAGTSSLNGC